MAMSFRRVPSSSGGTSLRPASLNGVTAPGGRNAIMPHTALLRQAITGYLNDPSRAADAELVVGGGLGSLPILVELLREDAPIERTERLEALYKQVLRALLTRPIC